MEQGERYLFEMSKDPKQGRQAKFGTDGTKNRLKGKVSNMTTQISVLALLLTSYGPDAGQTISFL